MTHVVSELWDNNIFTEESMMNWGEKPKQIDLEWNPGDDILVFLSKVQKLKEELEDEYDLDWADGMRLTHVVSELSDSNIFTEEAMMN